MLDNGALVHVLGRYRGSHARHYMLVAGQLADGRYVVHDPYPRRGDPRGVRYWSEDVLDNWVARGNGTYTPVWRP